MPQSPVTSAATDLLQHLWQAVRALPEPVVDRARRLWLDTVSCAASGLQADEPQRWLALQAAGDAGPVPLPGSATRLGTSAATMALAVGACWDEACEGLALAHGRPGVPVVAALWAELAGQRPTWQALWQATAVGYEVAARLGARLRMREGLHVDGVWGAFGAAAALVHLRGGTAKDAAAALEACATQLPFSLVRPARQGASIRNLYLGHSAWLGRQAALAVAAGLGTPTGAIDDVIELMLDGAPQGHWPEAGAWCLLDSYWKPFAAVRHVHYGAQAALALRDRLPALGGKPETIDAIDAIELTVYPEALQYCANRDPQSVLGAQFSLSFGVAAALRFGDLSPAEFRAPRFHDAGLRRLEGLLQVRADGQRFAGPARGARLALRHAGHWLQVDQGAVSGDAGHQPDATQVQRKFDQYTRHDAGLARWAGHVLHDSPQAPACHPEAP